MKVWPHLRRNLLWRALLDQCIDLCLDFVALTLQELSCNYIQYINSTFGLHFFLFALKYVFHQSSIDFTLELMVFQMNIRLHGGPRLRAISKVDHDTATTWRGSLSQAALAARIVEEVIDPLLWW